VYGAFAISGRRRIPHRRPNERAAVKKLTMLRLFLPKYTVTSGNHAVQKKQLSKGRSRRYRINTSYSTIHDSVKIMQY